MVYGIAVAESEHEDASCVALMLASQAVGITRIQGVLQCQGVATVVEVLKVLGVRVFAEEDGGAYVVEGVGIGGLKKLSNVLYVGFSSFVACVVMGMLSTYPFTSFLYGDSDLVLPHGIMARLSPIGVQFVGSDDKLPVGITGCEDGVPIDDGTVISSSGIKAAMLFAALNIRGKNIVYSRSNIGSYMEPMLRHIGTDISVTFGKGVDTIMMHGHQELIAQDMQMQVSI